MCALRFIITVLRNDTSTFEIEQKNTLLVLKQGGCFYEENVFYANIKKSELYSVLTVSVSIGAYSIPSQPCTTIWMSAYFLCASSFALSGETKSTSQQKAEAIIGTEHKSKQAEITTANSLFKFFKINTPLNFLKNGFFT